MMNLEVRDRSPAAANESTLVFMCVGNIYAILVMVIGSSRMAFCIGANIKEHDGVRKDAANIGDKKIKTSL